MRLAAQGAFPPDLLIGRWWATSGEPCEIDVQGTQTALVGEAKWQPDPIGLWELEHLRRKAARVPRLVDTTLYVLWGRAGLTENVRRAGARGFDLPAILA